MQGLKSVSATETLKAEDVINEELKKVSSLATLASRKTRKLYIENPKLSLQSLCDTLPQVIKDFINFSELDSKHLHNLLQDIQDKLDPIRRRRRLHNR